MSSEKLNLYQQIKKAKHYTLPNDEIGQKITEKHKFVMRKCEKSIEKYKNRVICAKPWIGKKNVSKKLNTKP